MGKDINTKPKSLDGVPVMISNGRHHDGLDTFWQVSNSVTLDTFGNRFKQTLRSNFCKLKKILEIEVYYLSPLIHVLG